MTDYKITLRASKLDSAADCMLQGLASSVPEMFKDFGYEIRQTPLYVTPLIGSGIHAGVASIHTDGEHSLETLTQTSMAELLRLIAEEQKTRNVLFTKNFPNLEVINVHIKEVIQAYVEQALPHRKAKLVEQNFKGELAKDIVYSSTLDLFDVNDVLCDLKTGAKITPAYNQMGFYLLLLKKHGYEPKGVVLDYFVRENKAANTGALTHTPIEYDHSDCMLIARTTMTHLVESFRKFKATKSTAGVMINPRSSSCNAVMCPLFQTTTCGGWRKK